MAEPKTRPTGESVAKHLAAIEDAEQRADAKTVCALMQSASKNEPEMWGTDIVGFGRVSMPMSGGRVTEWMRIAFAVRKDRVTLYLAGLGAQGALLKKLGRHQRGGGCLHLKRLADVDMKVLERLIKDSLATMDARYGAPQKAATKKVAAKKPAKPAAATKKVAKKKAATKKAAKKKAAKKR